MRHPSPITRHTSHITHHASPITRHLQCVTHLTPRITLHSLHMHPHHTPSVLARRFHPRNFLCQRRHFSISHHPMLHRRPAPVSARDSPPLLPRIRRPHPPHITSRALLRQVNPKPQTPNPKPQTPNPKHSYLAPSLSQLLFLFIVQAPPPPQATLQLNNVTLYQMH